MTTEQEKEQTEIQNNPDSQGNIVVGTEVADPMMSTRKAIYMLFLGVGGTGKEILASMIPNFASKGIKFGQLARTKSGTYIFPDAIYVDTDVSEATAEERKAEELSVTPLKELGVKIVRLISGTDREALLKARQLADSITKPLPPKKLDPRGAGADTRVGKLELLIAESKEDDNNPLNVAESIVRNWRTGLDVPLLGPEARLIIFGGIHGGTGPLSLELGEQIAENMRRDLSGAKTQLAKVRYVMTGESSSTDPDLNDGLAWKRNLNTAASILSLNSAYARKGVSLSPDQPDIKDYVPGGDFTFVVGCANPKKEMRSHYDPATVIADHIANELTGDIPKPREMRNNMRPQIPDIGAKYEEAVPVMPVFSSLGIASLRSREGINELTLKKRIILFTKTIGLEGSNAATIDDKIKSVFVETLRNDVLESIELPAMESTEFGEPEDIPTNVASKCSEYMSNIEVDLANTISTIVKEVRDDLAGNLKKILLEIKKSDGLDTVMGFIDAAISSLDAFDTNVKEELSTNYSENKLGLIESRLKTQIKSMQDVKLPLFNIPFLNNRAKALNKLTRDAGNLAAAYTKYANLIKNSKLLKEMSAKLVISLKDLLMEFKTYYELEKSKALVILKNAGDYPADYESEKPLDVLVNVDMTIHDNSKILRENSFKKGTWDEKEMEDLMKSIKATATDTNLLDYLKEEDVRDALDAFSSPLVRPASVLSAGALSDAAKVKVVAVPVLNGDLDNVQTPDGFTKFAAGEGMDYKLITELHGINPLDDRYLRDCIEKLLLLPPTLKQAQELAKKYPHESFYQQFVNRESMMSAWEGRYKPITIGASRSLAERQLKEAGMEGEVAVCSGEDCGLSFLRTQEEKDANTGKYCKCCRLLYEGEGGTEEIEKAVDIK